MAVCCEKNKTVLYYKFLDKEGLIELPPCVEFEQKRSGSWWYVFTYATPPSCTPVNTESRQPSDDPNDVFTEQPDNNGNECPGYSSFKQYKNGVCTGGTPFSVTNNRFEFRYGDEYELIAKVAGKKVWSDKGKGQPRYYTACDNDCPSQTMRCRTSAYPGSRCVPCSQFRR
jgi:hypothetical protein